MKYPCPVCGYNMDDPPQDYNICPSCGTEFSYHDAGTTYEVLRQEWIDAGAPWWSPVDKKPLGWNPYVQLFQAGLAFRPDALFSTTSGISSSGGITIAIEDIQEVNSTLALHYRIGAAEAA